MLRLCTLPTPDSKHCALGPAPFPGPSLHRSIKAMTANIQMMAYVSSNAAEKLLDWMKSGGVWHDPPKRHYEQAFLKSPENAIGHHCLASHFALSKAPLGVGYVVLVVGIFVKWFRGGDHMLGPGL